MGSGVLVAEDMYKDSLAGPHRLRRGEKVREEIEVASDWRSRIQG